MNPPDGSRIRIESENTSRCIVVPYASGSILRYLIGAFLLFWLAGWSFGVLTALEKISGGEDDTTFLISWLGGWIIGGLFAGYFAYRFLRPSVSERFVLKRPLLEYDSGVPPMQIFSGFGMRSHVEFYRNLFPKRRKITFDASELASLRLRETDTANRITIDKGAERINLATGASEVEREWLYEHLRREYS